MNSDIRNQLLTELNIINNQFASIELKEVPTKLISAALQQYREDVKKYDALMKQHNILSKQLRFNQST